MLKHSSTDHPRACGANHSSPRLTKERPGSSPRVRGKLEKHVADVPDVRIIPARAGQTSPPIMVYGWPTDHPRACGANMSSLMLRSYRSGSSPRVRGKRRWCGPLWLLSRIIPARAGQTRASRILRLITSDHPRACGANVSAEVDDFLQCGSSPRVRGKPSNEHKSENNLRIIPARAGQTWRRSSRRRSSPDHPRACGANEPILPPCHVQIGSSPRVRGKLLQHVPAHAVRRIIPARAGQTCRYIIVFLTVSDHPRACGANYDALIGERTECGSSPRVRGKRCRLRWSFCFVRIIPARAGQTAGRCQLPLSAADHPRACGANFVRRSLR